MNSEYLESLVEQIKLIDTKGLSDKVSKDAISTIIEDQKVYFWIRLYLKEEDNNIEIGDDVSITWENEVLKTKFICYGKKDLIKDYQDEIVNYNPEEDRKVICLMIDTKMVNGNEDIPFIRTLFKTGYHYEYQLIKRDELLFINDKNGVVLDYFDCDF